MTQIDYENKLTSKSINRDWVLPHSIRVNSVIIVQRATNKFLKEYSRTGSMAKYILNNGFDDAEFGIYMVYVFADGGNIVYEWDISVFMRNYSDFLLKDPERQGRVA